MREESRPGVCYSSRMSETLITIPERFRGPPQSGNGGYVCGVLAGMLTDGDYALPDARAAEVTLRLRVPLDRVIAVRRTDDTLTAHDGETLIAEAALTTLELEVPEPASFDEALAVQSSSPAL